MKYILNGWSWTMPKEFKGNLHYEDLTEEEFYQEIEEGAVSCIGNPALARVLRVPYRPSYISLNADDKVIVVNICGGNLPYGCRRLPDDVELKFTKITFFNEEVSV